MSYLGRKWGFAIESSGAGEVLDAPTAEFNIEVNPDVDETGAPLEAVDAEGNPTIDVVQTEIVEDQADIEETADQVEKLEDTAEVLEHYAAAIEHRIQTNGGLTAGEYEFLMIGLESRVKNAGHLMPSVESVSRGRLAASREALDSIKEGIRKVWETIKRAIQSLYRKVKGWFIKTFDGAKMLAVRAEGVKKKNDKISGGIEDTSGLELGSGDGAKLMDKDGKPCADGRALLTGLGQLKYLVTEYVKHYSDDCDEYFNKLSTSITAATNKAKGMTIEVFITSFQTLNEQYKKNPLGKAAGGKTPTKDHMTDPELDYGTIPNNDLMGGKTVIIISGLKNKSNISSLTLEQMKKDLESQRVMIKPFYAKHKEYTDGTSKVMVLSEISSACDLIITICNMITDYRKQWLNRERLVDQINRDIDSAVKDVDSEEYDKLGVASGLKQVIRGVGKLVTNQINDQVALIGYVLSTCKAALSYCTRSQSRHKTS